MAHRNRSLRRSPGVGGGKRNVRLPHLFTEGGDGASTIDTFAKLGKSKLCAQAPERRQRLDLRKQHRRRRHCDESAELISEAGIAKVIAGTPQAHARPTSQEVLSPDRLLWLTSPGSVKVSTEDSASIPQSPPLALRSLPAASSAALVPVPPSVPRPNAATTRPRHRNAAATDVALPLPEAQVESCSNGTVNGEKIGAALEGVFGTLSTCATEEARMALEENEESEKAAEISSRLRFALEEAFDNGSLEQTLLEFEEMIGAQASHTFNGETNENFERASEPLPPSSGISKDDGSVDSLLSDHSYERARCVLEHAVDNGKLQNTLHRLLQEDKLAMQIDETIREESFEKGEDAGEQLSLKNPLDEVVHRARLALEDAIDNGKLQSTLSHLLNLDRISKEFGEQFQEEIDENLKKCDEQLPPPLGTSSDEATFDKHSTDDPFVMAQVALVDAIDNGDLENTMRQLRIQAARDKMRLALTDAVEDGSLEQKMKEVRLEKARAKIRADMNRNFEDGTLEHRVKEIKNTRVNEKASLVLEKKLDGAAERSVDELRITSARERLRLILEENVENGKLEKIAQEIRTQNIRAKIRSALEGAIDDGTLEKTVHELKRRKEADHKIEFAVVDAIDGNPVDRRMHQIEAPKMDSEAAATCKGLGEPDQGE